MVKEKGPPESSVFTMFKRQTANTKLLVSDKKNDIVTSSRVSIISKNPEADTTPNIGVNRFINAINEPFVEPPPPPLTETFTSQTFIGFDTAVPPDYLNVPLAVAVGSNGNVYISDTGNGRVERISADAITTLASGLDQPAGLALDSYGNVFIALLYASFVVRVDVATGAITTVAGNGTLDLIGDGGPATDAVLAIPNGVAVDASGNIFICDSLNYRIRKIAVGTNIITTVAGTGTAGFSGDGGPATDAALTYPNGVAVDADGNLFIADTENHRIRRVAAGTGIISTVAGNGTQGFSGDGGLATTAQLNYPFGVAVDASGNIFIADTQNNRIRKVTNGIITTVVENLKIPSGVAVDGSGNIFIADTENNRIRRLDSQTGVITTFAGAGYMIGTPNTYISASSPRGVAVSDGKIYVSNTDGHNIYVFSKQFSTLEAIHGTGLAGIRDTPELLEFNQPYRVAVDSGGNIYVADTLNNRIRKINVTDGSATTVAGGGANTNTSSGAATSKSLNRPNGVAVFGSIVYFTNTGANTVCKVEGGNISNLPGSYSAPEGIAVDSAGNVYIANAGLNQISIVATDNSTTNITFSDGTIPRGVAVDGNGAIYIADGGMNRILRLKTDSSTGLLSNIPMAIGLNNPMDVSVDTDGTLYVADYGNNKIVKIVTTFV